MEEECKPHPGFHSSSDQAAQTKAPATLSGEFTMTGTPEQSTRRDAT